MKLLFFVLWSRVNLLLLVLNSFVLRHSFTNVTGTLRFYYKQSSHAGKIAIECLCQGLDDATTARFEHTIIGAINGS